MTITTNEKTTATTSKSNVAPLTLIEILDERSIDLSNPKDIKAFMGSLTLEENLTFFPLVANRLLVEGIYRQASASNAKGHKVGTPEYADAMRAGFSVWERGYLTIAEETRAHNKVAKQGGSGGALPFTQVEILEEMAQLLPTGNGEKAKHIRASYEVIKGYDGGKFGALLIAVSDNPMSLVNVAVANLRSRANEKAVAAQTALVASVELI